MKVVLFCGGKGTRWARAEDDIPKALAPIGDRPIIWHVMNVYSLSGFDDFVLCLGHQAHKIVRYFIESGARQDRDPAELIVRAGARSWRVRLVDTGQETQTGGRLGAVAGYIGRERYMASYGDGLARLDLADLLRFHVAHGRLATLTAVRPASQFGILELSPEGRVQSFVEKPRLKEWVNGGFFVFEPEVLDLLDEGPLENGPLSQLSREDQLVAYRTDDFWACLDTYKDVIMLDQLWRKGDAPWSMRGTATSATNVGRGEVSLSPVPTAS
jgi:glucose-1-phosphate cytidylyltransferase